MASTSKVRSNESIPIDTILGKLLKEQPGPTPAYDWDHQSQSLLARRVATLKQQAPREIEEAQRAGVEIKYLGVNPLFDTLRLYRGIGTNWVVGPVRRPEDLVVPAQQRRQLQRLHAAGRDFPLIFMAHEVSEEKTRELVASGQGHVILDDASAADIIGPIPSPVESVTIADNLNRRSTRVLRTVRRTAIAGGAVAAGIAAAPVVLVGGALAGLAHLDPIILGAVPARYPHEGEPAAWYILAQWDW